LEGDVPERDPAWGENSVVPDPDEIDTMFCAAVPTLMIRALNMFDEGYVVPTCGNPQYDGGTVCYVEYYDGYGTLEPFDEDFASNNSGTLCLRPFANASSDQGHAMVSWRGMAVQTFPPDGLNYDYTVSQSHDGGYYLYMVRPWNWLPITRAEYYEDEPAEPQPVPQPEPGQGTPLTVDLLVKAMTGNSFAGPDLDRATAERFFPHLVAVFKKWGVNSRARISAFIAQMGSESGSFQWMREFSRGEGHPYGFYYGRGIGQLTWEENYQRYQNDTGIGAHTDPEMVADNLFVACDSAGWHWDYKDLNPLADQATWQAFYEITGRWWGISGPFAERDARYSVAWYALPADVVLPGDEGEAPQPGGWPKQDVYVSADKWAYVRGPNGPLWLRGSPGDMYEAQEGEGWLQAHLAEDRSKAPPDFNAAAYINARYGTGAAASPEYQKAAYGRTQVRDGGVDKVIVHPVDAQPRTPSDYVPKPPSDIKEAPVADATPKPPLEQREPAVVISSVIGIMVGVLALAGIALTADQIAAFEIVLGVLLPILSAVAAGVITRGRVTPTVKGGE
jgi:putative chitinase